MTSGRPLRFWGPLMGAFLFASTLFAQDAGEPGICGNGIVEDSEACDGADLSAETCNSATMGAFPAGVLACSADCTFDTSACIIAAGGSGGGGSGGTVFGGVGGVGGVAGFGGTIIVGGTTGMDPIAPPDSAFDAAGPTVPAEPTEPPGCVPGMQVECACPVGANSFQTCNEDGTRFDPCDCSSEPPAAPAEDEPGPSADSGCGCRLGGEPPSNAPALLAIGLALTLRRRLRRRRRSQPGR